MTNHTASMLAASDAGRALPRQPRSAQYPPQVAVSVTAIARHFGIANPLPVPNSAAALDLALELAGVGAGDEVIVPAQTSLASGMAILMRRATPVFVDIDPRDGNITPAALQEKITPRTTAVLPGHWGGYPCDLAAIQRVALMYGLAVIEDGGTALGASYRGVPIGASSRFTCLTLPPGTHSSINSLALLCCRHTRDCRAARERLQRSQLGEESPPEPLGPEAATTPAWSDIPQLQQQITRRQAIGSLYRARLANVPGLDLPPLADDRTHAYSSFTVLVQRRDDFVHRLQSHGIAVAVAHQSMERFSACNSHCDGLPGQRRFNALEAILPLQPQIGLADVERIAEVIRAGW
jgi:perosamine synthetase